jgi:hypothetical protein
MRLKASSTTARYTLPSPVGCSVTSTIHNRSGSTTSKDAVHGVLGRLGGRVTAGAASPAAPIDASHAGLAHQALHPFAGASDALAQPQLGVHPWRPVGAAAHAVDVDDGVGQIGVVKIPGRRPG